MGKNQHVVKTPSGWGVKGDNNTRVTQNFDTYHLCNEIINHLN